MRPRASAAVQHDLLCMNANDSYTSQWLRGWESGANALRPISHNLFHPSLRAANPLRMRLRVSSFVRGAILIFGLLLSVLAGCESEACKSLKNELCTICRDSRKSCSSATNLSEPKDYCATGWQELLKLKDFNKLNEEAHAAGLETFCTSLQKAHRLDFIKDAVEYYRLAFAKKALEQLEAAIQKDDLKRAETLLQEIEATGKTQLLERAYVDVGRVFLRPSEGGTTRRSLITARRKKPPHGRGCVSSGSTGFVRKRQAEATKAYELFVKGKDYALAARAAYLMKDLKKFDQQVKGRPDDYQTALLRVRMLGTLGRDQEALKTASMAATKFMDDETCFLVSGAVSCKKSKPKPLCEPLMAIGKLNEKAMNYTAARNAYRQASRYHIDTCGSMAAGRLEGLQGAVDGQPLAVFRVSGSVFAPRGTKLRILLAADVKTTMNPVPLLKKNFEESDPTHMDNFTKVYVLEASVKKGSST